LFDCKINSVSELAGIVFILNEGSIRYFYVVSIAKVDKLELILGLITYGGVCEVICFPYLEGIIAKATTLTHDFVFIFLHCHIFIAEHGITDLTLV
jgi:hypothetical protein